MVGRMAVSWELRWAVGRAAWTVDRSAQTKADKLAAPMAVHWAERTEQKSVDCWAARKVGLTACHWVAWKVVVSVEK